MTTRRSRPGAALADLIWYELRIVRAGSVQLVPTTAPDEYTQKIRGGALQTNEQQEFYSACERLTAAAVSAGADIAALAARIRRAWDRARVEAAKARASFDNRLDMAQRADYRKQAAQAGDLARWLASELAERPIAQAEDATGAVFTFSGNREVLALGDLLRQRIGRVGTNAELDRADELVKSLRWMAALLRADAARAKPAKRPPAPWKPTARALRQAFVELLGAPHLPEVATLAGLAHRCEVPRGEVSRLR